MTSLGETPLQAQTADWLDDDRRLPDCPASPARGAEKRLRCSPSLPCVARAGGLAALLVLLAPLLALAQALLVVGVKVGRLVVLGFGLQLRVDVKHVLALLHLLQELVGGLQEDRA